jgi:ABC-type polysaccharide/polyol phosphate export permease
MNSLKYYNGRIIYYYNLSSAVAIRNVKLRYKNSALGFLWSLLNPLMYLCIFIVVFNNAFPIENYPLYALTGLIFWSFFSATSVQVINSITTSGGILKSLNVPPVIFPISYVLSSLINLFLSLIPFFILMLFFGFRPSLNVLYVFPGILFLALFTFGTALILSAFNVFFRDVEMFYNTIIPAIFYLTPIAYPIEEVPERFQPVIKLNPLYHYTCFFRDILYHNKTPDLNSILFVATMSFLAAFAGIIVFNKLKKGFISHL